MINVYVISTNYIAPTNIHEINMLKCIYLHLFTYINTRIILYKYMNNYKISTYYFVDVLRHEPCWQSQKSFFPRIDMSQFL